MSSGSFKKVAKSHQRVYKERSQPAHRAHLGQLAKHKDYVQQARDHHKKADKLKLLKRKAQERNPDEFYFNMVSTEKVDGVHQTRKGKAKSESEEKTTEEQELLMAQKDLRYVVHKRNIELKKIEKLQSTLSFLHPKFRVNKQIVFVDRDEDVEKAKAELEKKREAEERLFARDEEQQQEIEKTYALLAKRQKRLKELTVMIEKLEVSLHLSKDKKGKKKLVKEETKDSAAQYRWCYNRKR